MMIELLAHNFILKRVEAGIEFLKESNNFFQILLHLPDNKNLYSAKHVLFLINVQDQS